jgi:hypothetical protein
MVEMKLTMVEMMIKKMDDDKDDDGYLDLLLLGEVFELRNKRNVTEIHVDESVKVNTIKTITMAPPKIF